MKIGMPKLVFTGIFLILVSAVLACGSSAAPSASPGAAPAEAPAPVVEHGCRNCIVNGGIVRRFVSYGVFFSRGDLSFGACGTCGGGSFGERPTCSHRRPGVGRSSRRARG